MTLLILRFLYCEVDAHGHLWRIATCYGSNMLSYLRACIAAPYRKQVPVRADHESYFVTLDAQGKVPELISMDGLSIVGNALI